MTRVFKIALLGAESTGKTQLAHDLVAHLAQQDVASQAVDEYLREWCEAQGRTPQPSEQAEIALQQRLRIEQAVRDIGLAIEASDGATSIGCVLADTTPLMTAVYSEFIFQDSSLHAAAMSYQRSFDLTVLTGLDMPWQADGIQRDGPHVRAPVDALLRRLLQEAGIPYEVVYGQGDQRLHNAALALQRLEAKHAITTNSVALSADSIRAESQNNLKKWQWNCEKCSDPDCEHRLFRKLIAKSL
jgi:nicotinamide riboside kinase